MGLRLYVPVYEFRLCVSVYEFCLRVFVYAFCMHPRVWVFVYAFSFKRSPVSPSWASSVFSTEISEVMSMDVS